MFAKVFHWLQTGHNVPESKKKYKWQMGTMLAFWRRQLPSPGWIALVVRCLVWCHEQYTEKVEEEWLVVERLMMTTPGVIYWQLIYS